MGRNTAVRSASLGILLLLAGCATADAPRVAEWRFAWSPDGSDPVVAAAPAEDVAIVDVPLPGSDPAPVQAAPEQDRNSIAPYLFAAGITGDIKAHGLTAEVDESFSDILSGLDLGLMLGYEHRFDSWTLIADSLYVRLQENTKVGGNSIDSTLQESYLELSGATPVAKGSPVELIGGVRGWHMSLELDSAANNVDKSSSWLDPIVGARWTVPLSPAWWLRLRGDVGGFGLGSASDFTWQATAMLAWSMSQRTSLVFGYRYLSVDRTTGGDDQVEAKLAMSGALLGAEFRF